MRLLKYSARFKKDLKKYQHDRKVLSELELVLDCLIGKHPLDKKYHNHRLKGEFVDCYECHIYPDVLMIYKIEKDEICILLLRIGSHAKLFS